MTLPFYEIKFEYSIPTHTGAASEPQGQERGRALVVLEGLSRHTAAGNNKELRHPSHSRTAGMKYTYKTWTCCLSVADKHSRVWNILVPGNRSLRVPGTSTFPGLIPVSLYIPPDKTAYLGNIPRLICVIGQTMSCPVHDQLLFWCTAGLIQLLHHEEGHELVSIPVNEQNRDPGFSDLLERRGFSEGVPRLDPCNQTGTLHKRKAR